MGRVISFKHKGNFSKTQLFLSRARNAFKSGAFDEYGKKGVQALASATPTDTGKTASSWYYEVHHNIGSVTIEWLNSNVNKGVPIAIVLQYGHGTQAGTYVKGIDYVNPAMKTIFNDMADSIWKEVTK